MKINTQSSLALHILLLIAALSEQKKLTSESIAMSTGSNPVVIRNVLGKLKRAGLVQVRRGSGGAYLAMDAKDITLAMVNEAVDPNSMKNLIGLHPSPAFECPVGRNIHALLQEPYDAVRTAVHTTLQSYTLADLLENFYATVGDLSEYQI